MKHLKSLITSTLLLILLAMPIVVHAQGAPTAPGGSSAPSISDPFAGSCGTAGGKKTDYCKNQVSAEGSRSLVFGDKSLAATIAQIIVFLTGVISVIMIIIGGFRYVLSNGDTGGVANAKNTILYALIGLAVAAVAQLIVSFVLSKFV